MKKICVSELVEGMVSDQTICDERGKILISKGIVLTNSIIARLENFDVCNIYIQGGEESNKEASVKEIADSIYENKVINIQSNRNKIEDILLAALERADVKPLVDNLAKEERLFKHGLRTAIVSLNTALRKRYNSEKLTTLAIGAMLHDCGMNKFIVDDVEHPLTGYGKIINTPSLDMEVALICLQHHERYNGSGFPFSFGKTQITEFAFLVAIVDYYDRLLLKSGDPRRAFFATIEKKGVYFEPGMIGLFGSTIDWGRFYSIN